MTEKGNRVASPASCKVAKVAFGLLARTVASSVLLRFEDGLRRVFILPMRHLPPVRLRLALACLSALVPFVTPC